MRNRNRTFCKTPALYTHTREGDRSPHPVVVSLVCSHTFPCCTLTDVQLLISATTIPLTHSLHSRPAVRDCATCEMCFEQEAVEVYELVINVRNRFGHNYTVSLNFNFWPTKQYRAFKSQIVYDPEAPEEAQCAAHAQNKTGAWRFCTLPHSTCQLKRKSKESSLTDTWQTSCLSCAPWDFT